MGFVNQIWKFQVVNIFGNVCQLSWPRGFGNQFLERRVDVKVETEFLLQAPNIRK